MKVRTLALLIACSVVISEAGLAIWRSWPVAASTAPVFRWTGPPEGNIARTPAAWTMRVYGADRGLESEFVPGTGRKVEVAYFEFDRVELGPILDLNRHAPEFCNSTAGFEFLGHGEPRVFAASGGSPIVFDVTHFKSPAGEVVHVFKATWLQGVGSWNLRPGRDRWDRLRGSLMRNVGQGRVLQGGVMGVAEENDAWVLFQESVLRRLEWN